MDYAGIGTLLVALTGLVVVVFKFIIDFYKLRKEMEKMAENVLKIEIATNSMKDALVKAAKESGRLEGAETERAEERQRQDDVKGTEEDPIHVQIKEESNLTPDKKIKRAL